MKPVINHETFGAQRVDYSIKAKNVLRAETKKSFNYPAVF